MKLGKKKGINEVSKREKEKREKLSRILFGFVMALVLFVGLVTVEGAIIKNEVKVSTVVAIADIPERKVIDKNELSNYFTVVELPETFRPDDALSSVDDLGDIIVTKYMSINSVLTTSCYTSKDDIRQAIEDPVEIAISIGDLSTSVAGKIRSGDIINISRIVQRQLDEKSFEFEVEYLFENAFVVEAHTGTPAVTREDTDTSANIITVYVPRDKELDIYKAMSEGTLRVGLVKNGDGTEYKVNSDIVAKNSGNVVTENSTKNENTQNQNNSTVDEPDETEGTFSNGALDVEDVN